MNHGLGPHPARIGQLKNYAAPAFARSTTTRHRSAIEIAVSIKSDAFVGFATIRATRKVVEHRVSPARCRRRELKNRAAAESSARHGRTVNIPRAVRNQLRVDVLTICGSGETIDHLYRTRRPSDTGQHGDRPIDV